MKPQVKAFRDAAAQVCRARRVSFKEFLEDPAKPGVSRHMPAQPYINYYSPVRASPCPT